MDVKLKDVLEREFKGLGKSINTVAVETGIPSSTLHAWLHGQLPSGKNIHYLKTLSDYLGLGLSMLLFNTKDDKSKSKILFSSEFMDQDVKYRLTIEKLKE